MSLRLWAIRPSELRPLNRTGLMIFAVRCCLRVEAFAPPSLGDRWTDGLRRALSHDPATEDAQDLSDLARVISDLGAMAGYGHDDARQVELGRCAGRAAAALSDTLLASLVDERPALVKRVIEVTRDAGSIPAVLAHAGLHEVPSEAGDPVDHACGRYWDAARADIAVVSAASDVESTLDGARRLGPITGQPILLNPQSPPR